MLPISIPKYNPIQNVNLKFIYDKNSYVICDEVNGFDINEFTLEFWIEVKLDAEGFSCPFSYSIKDGIQNLTVENLADITIIINGESEHTGISFEDGKWNHFALTWIGSSGKWILYKNGERAATGVIDSLSKMHNKGTLVIGQYQASKGGGFTSDTAFVGQLAHLRLWSKARNTFFIKQDMKRTLWENQPIFNWQNLAVNLQVKNKEEPFVFQVPKYITAFDNGLFLISETGRLFYSSDYGEFWKEETDEYGISPNLKQIAATDSFVMAVTKDNELRTSTDNGKNWRSYPESPELVQVSINSSAAMGVTLDDKLLVSEDKGEKWIEPNGASKLKQVSLGKNNAYAVSVSNLLYKSTNLGKSWIKIDLDFEITQVSHVQDKVIVLTKNREIYFSNDDTNWTEISGRQRNITLKQIQLFEQAIFGIDSKNQPVIYQFDTSLVLHLPMNEGYGNTIFDWSDNSNNGTLSYYESGEFPEWKVTTMLQETNFA